jgi:hypothetical protein
VLNSILRQKGKWINGGHNRTTINEFYGACQTFKRSQSFVFEKDEPPGHYSLLLRMMQWP